MGKENRSSPPSSDEENAERSTNPVSAAESSDEQELPRTNNADATSAVVVPRPTSAAGSGGGPDAASVEPPSSRKPVGDAAAVQFKTRLCKDYEQRGWCSWGQLCIFAHGRRELRTQAENEKMGITTELAVQRERAKLLSDNKRDRPPPPIDNSITVAATCQPPGALPLSTVPTATYMLPAPVADPLFLPAMQTVSYPTGMLPPYLASQPMPNVIPVPALFYPFGLMGALPVPPMDQQVQKTLPFQQPELPLPHKAIANALSANAKPFVPTTFTNAAESTHSSSVPPPDTSAVPLDAKTDTEEDEEDVAIILRGLEQAYMDRTQSNDAQDDYESAATAPFNGPVEEDDEDDTKLSEMIEHLRGMHPPSDV